jgi:proteasome lid subunit RPN8/RPN11
MVDDIQLIDLRDDEDVQSDEPEVQAQTAEPQSRGLPRPHVGAREAVALMVLTGALLIGVGVYGASTGESASLLWLLGGFSFFGGGSDDEAEASEPAEQGRPDAVSLSDVDDADTVESSSDAPAASSAVTRGRPEMSVAEADGEREVDMLVKTLMREGEERPLPDASGIVAPIRRPMAATLEGIPQELTVLRRDVGPVLVGITYNEKTVDRLSTAYDTMLVVAPHHEDALPEVLKYLPALIQTNGVSGLGSARTFTIPAPEPPGPEAASQATLKDLRGHKGEPLHPLARAEPDFITVSAPSEWTDRARDILSSYAPIIDIIEWDTEKIHVAGFVFDNAIDLPDHIVDHDQAGDGSTDSVEKGNEYPPGSGAGQDGSAADDRPEAAGGATHYSGDPDADTGTDTSSAATDDGTESPSGADRGDRTLTPPDRDSTSDSGWDTPDSTGGEPVGGGSVDGGGTEASSQADQENTTPPGRETTPDAGHDTPEPTGCEPVAGGTVDGETEDDGSPAGAATVPGDADSRPDDSPDNSSSTADGTDPDTSAQSADSSPESDDNSPATGQSAPEKQSSSGDSNAGGPVDEDGDDTDSGEAENSSPSPSGEAPETDDEVPDPDTTSAENSTPSEESGPGDESSVGGGTLPPADVDIDFGTDTGPKQTPSDANSDKPSSDGDDDSPPSRKSSGDSDAASQSASGRSGSTGDTSQSSGTAAGDDFATSSSSAPAGPTPGTPDDEGRTSSVAPEPSYDADDGHGIVPFGEAPASCDPAVVDITQHVLNELAYQATATPDREVYSVVYADEDGLIRHHHAIDHPDFLKSRKKSISFTSAFFKHLRLLATQRKDIGHRLAGGSHSHPSGRPLQSPADKRFTRRIWQTQRNTSFVIGVNEGSGPDEWTITDDGKEVKRQLNEYLVRIRAFSGKTEPKQIRLHQDMGQ